MVLDNLTQVGKIGLGLFITGTVIFLIGFSVPYWIVFGNNYNVGLWRHCTPNVCRSTTTSNFRFFDIEGPPDWYRGTQALACLALIALVADFLVRLLFICGKPKSFLLISVICDCAAAVLAFLAAAVFGDKVNQYINMDLHWGFAFDIIGGIILSGAAACFFVEYCRHR